MARSLYPQKSINSFIPDPFPVKNLVVDDDATIGETIIAKNATVAETITAKNATIDEDLSTGNATVNGELIASSIEVENLTVTADGAATLTSVSEDASGIKTAQQQATIITPQTKVLLLRTTGAGGPFVITPTNMGTNIYKITIIMLAYNTSAYTFACLQGTVTFAGVGHAASFIWNGINWSLVGQPFGATVS